MVETNELREGIDLKKLILFFQKKIGMVLLAGVAGALIGSGLYLLITALTSGPQEYKITYDFYVDFSDGTMEAHDYYNAYTWNDVLKKDFVLDEIMATVEQEEIMMDSASPSKEEVASSIEATCPTDVKYLNVTVTYANEKRAEDIVKACAAALKDFGTKMEEFDSIDLVSVGKVTAVPKAQFSLRAMMCGIITFVMLYILLFLFRYACDDAVYLPKECEDRFDIRVLGMVGKKNEKELTHGNKQSDQIRRFHQYLQKELLLNLDYTIKHDRPVYVCAATEIEKDCQNNERICEEAIEACEEMNRTEKSMMQEEHTFSSYDFQKVVYPIESRKQLDEIRKGCGVILAIPCGVKNSKIIEKLIHDLTIQDCKILGAILTQADETFLRKYYGTWKGDKQR